MEGPPGLQDDPVATSLGVGELNLIAWGERAARLPDHPRQANGACLPLASWAPSGAAFPRRSSLAPQSRRRRAPPAFSVPQTPAKAWSRSLVARTPNTCPE